MDYQVGILSGLPDISIRESKERVKTAIKNSDIKLDSRKITINLSPANLKKEGSIYDLPIAIGILPSMEYVDIPKTNEYIFIGEMSLDGRINKINGILPMCIEAANLGIKKAIVPKENEYEASIVKDIEIFGAENLVQVIKHLNGIEEIKKTNCEYKKSQNTNLNILDFEEVKGQENIKRALEISAAGRT